VDDREGWAEGDAKEKEDTKRVSRMERVGSGEDELEDEERGGRGLDNKRGWKVD
jgi:hypothetical protein